ncbi:hypothetical protein F5Y19DRAFT_229340 [Xylariaceae sp. FL1651]|nr:hypothetical protein F5Y19DRAFT_229340 [Xylariaceae sp. FL1651]
MSGLETLGIVSNVFQIISFARETIALCMAVYRGRSPDDSLGENAASLATLSAQLQQYYQGKRPQAAAERQLSLLATRCGIAARSLVEEVGFLTGHKAKGSLAATLRLAVKTNWRKKRLETVEKSLHAYQKTLETHLLAAVCKQSDAIELTQREAFQELGGSLKHFVLQYASGHTRLSELVKEESLSVKDHTTRETSTAQRAVQSHITTKLVTAEKSITSHVNIKLEEATRKITSDMRHLNLETVTHAQRERLLRSLKFEAMNERRNHIQESHKGTFEWILRSRTTTSDSTFDDEISEWETDIDENSSDSIYESADDHVINEPAVESLPWHESSVFIDDNDSKFSDIADHSFIDSASYEETGETPSKLARDTDDDDLWDNFSDWLKSESKLYWISGKPGSGKSTLVKFILGNPLTREALDIWKPNTTILSYFFWKPGSRMQKSIKGLLCSLLYQALSEDQDALNVLLSSTPSLASKDDNTDWSFEELMTESIRYFSSTSRPFCIFIDGLDEISNEDGATALMKAINDIGTLPYIKICVASRPEPRFEKLLYNRQRLRLHDLTLEDMKQYAVNTLRPYLHCQSKSLNLQQTILYELVDKADGVFLWLCLAIQSLIRGYENGDNDDILLQRLLALPSELSRLYYDMWTRFNDDIPLYRKSAARYFNLIIDATDIHTKIEEITGEPYYSPYYQSNGNINIFQLMAATNTIVPVTLLDQRRELEESSLSQLCEDTQTAIKLRCAGLIEIQFQKRTGYYAWGAADRHRGVIPYLQTAVRWIHRSAYDFLRDSEDGHELRAHDGSSRSERIMLLMRAELAQRSTFRLLPYNHIYQVLIPLSWIRDADSREPVKDMLRICWDLYSSKHLTLTPAVLTARHPIFSPLPPGLHFETS